MDDLIEDSLEEKMISGIAKAHGVTLSDSDMDVLAFKTSDFSGVKAAVKSATRLEAALDLMPPQYFLELQKRFTTTLEKVSSNENPAD